MDIENAAAKTIQQNVFIKRKENILEMNVRSWARRQALAPKGSKGQKSFPVPGYFNPNLK